MSEAARGTIHQAGRQPKKNIREISQAAALNDLVEGSDKEQEVQEYANIDDILLSHISHSDYDSSGN